MGACLVIIVGAPNRAIGSFDRYDARSPAVAACKISFSINDEDWSASGSETNFPSLFDWTP
jgi:hypothetical protein